MAGYTFFLSKMKAPSFRSSSGDIEVIVCQSVYVKHFVSFSSHDMMGKLTANFVCFWAFSSFRFGKVTIAAILEIYFRVLLQNPVGRNGLFFSSVRFKFVSVMMSQHQIQPPWRPY